MRPSIECYFTTGASFIVISPTAGVLGAGNPSGFRYPPCDAVFICKLNPSADEFPVEPGFASNPREFLAAIVRFGMTMKAAKLQSHP